jgi:hypothetical protein
VIATTGFDYTPNAVQPLSFVAVQPHKMKRMAEGVSFRPTFVRGCTQVKPPIK